MISRIRSPFYIFFLNPVYVAARSLRSLCSNHTRLHSYVYQRARRNAVVVMRKTDVLFSVNLSSDLRLYSHDTRYRPLYITMFRILSFLTKINCGEISYVNSLFSLHCGFYNVPAWLKFQTKESWGRSKTIIERLSMTFTADSKDYLWFSILSL